MDFLVALRFVFASTCCGLGLSCMAADAGLNLSSLTTPIIFKGDTNTAYRDPAAVYHDAYSNSASRW